MTPNWIRLKTSPMTLKTTEYEGQGFEINPQIFHPNKLDGFGFTDLKSLTQILPSK